MRSRLLWLALCCLPLAQAAGEDAIRIWRTSYNAKSGSSHCGDIPVDVWESARVFSLHLENSSWEIWKVGLAEDGSADREFIAQGTHPADRPHIRVTIPPGHGPREFKIFNLSLGCDYTMAPGKYVK